MNMCGKTQLMQQQAVQADLDPHNTCTHARPSIILLDCYLFSFVESII